MEVITDIKAYQKKCFSEYKKDIGLSSEYKYLYGNPINVLVPIEVGIGKVMVIGAYPSAKFYTINGINDVPLLDNDSPFSNEYYYDGSKTRSIPSGAELNEMLNKIGIIRKDCWITDLVKVFLFKDGHAKKYNSLGKNDVRENRSLFFEFANKSIKWLEMEVELAKPVFVITLGAEVGAVIFNKSKEFIAKNYLDGKCREAKINNSTVNIISLPHPGILIRPDTVTKPNPWPEKFNNEISKNAKNEIKKLLENQYFA